MKSRTMKKTQFSPGAFSSGNVLVLSMVLFASSLVGQSSVRGWRTKYFDTASRQGTILAVDACSYSTMVLRHDGRIFVQGGSLALGVELPPAAPPGTHFVEVELGDYFGLGLLSDGRLLGWGDTYWSWSAAVVPPLPPGVTYTQMSASFSHAVALRSDGQIVAWGNNSVLQCNVPSMPTGRTVVSVKAGAYVSAALLSDGTVVPWGYLAADPWSTGFGNVPPLPAGTTYVGLELGAGFGLAMRSDGALVGWGDTLYGLSNVPALPPGKTWTKFAVGSSGAAALRSDGVLVVWGGSLMIDPPKVPAGMSIVDLAVGSGHGVALLSNGQVVSWGDSGFMQRDLPVLPIHHGSDRRVIHVDSSCGSHHALSVLSDGSLQAWGGVDWLTKVPQLPPNVTWRRAVAGIIHNLAITSNGDLIAWGDNGNGKCNVPALPPGVVYTDAAASSAHTVAVRSDGQAVAWGYSGFGALNIPPLPTGVQYVGADAYYAHTVLLRSDGAIANFGNNVNLTYTPPPGLRYVQLACGRYSVAAIRSDGAVDIWGSGLSTPLPQLPWGVSYVQAECGHSHIALRRSDGQVVVCGLLQALEDAVPPLDPGTSYVQISANDTQTLGRVGPTSTYSSFAPGCAGSLPPARLIPRETPRIGKTLEVTAFDLPHALAIQILGFQPLTTALPLGFVGMPGCDLHVTLDITYPLVGAVNQAKWTLPIPDDLHLVGVRIYNQAVVLDANAPNTFGAVMSNAAEGVIGLP